jgi:hypothetical protein
VKQDLQIESSAPMPYELQKIRDALFGFHEDVIDMIKMFTKVDPSLRPGTMHPAHFRHLVTNANAYDRA